MIVEAGKYKICWVDQQAGDLGESRFCGAKAASWQNSLFFWERSVFF